MEVGNKSFTRLMKLGLVRRKSSTIMKSKQKLERAHLMYQLFGKMWLTHTHHELSMQLPNKIATWIALLYYFLLFMFEFWWNIELE